MTKAEGKAVRQLDRELYAMVTHICLSKGNKKGEVRRHLEDFTAWVGKASILEKTWTRELGEKTRDMRLSLGNGRSEEELFEPLLRCVIEASSQIHLLLSDLEKQGKPRGMSAPESKTGGLPTEA
jgi:hypothetical protein